MIPLSKNIKCTVCDSSDVHYLFDCLDSNISKETFKIWGCSNCRHRFTYPVPPETEVGKYYNADHYISHTDTSKGTINKLYKLARRFTISEKRRFVQRQTGLASGRLLDVGTGTGAFLNTMEHAGWETVGIEPDFQARQKAYNLYKLPIHEPAHLFDLNQDSFEAITLWHVLEHVYNLHGYMKQFAKILKPAGLLFIAVPNHTSYDSLHYKSFWAGYDVPRHLHHFSPGSLQLLARLHGFSVVRKKAMWLDAFYISLLSEQYLHKKNRMLTAFFRGCISCIHTLFNLNKCSSIIYVLKKM